MVNEQVSVFSLLVSVVTVEESNGDSNFPNEESF